MGLFVPVGGRIIPIAIDYHLGGGSVDLPLKNTIAIEYQLGGDGVGDCMMHGSARASSMPSAKR